MDPTPASLPNQAYSNPMAARILILTGGQRVGKTTLCRRIARWAKDQGWSVAGVLSPAVFEGERKVGIEVTDLQSGESRRLADRRLKPAPGELAYQFNEANLAWGDAVLAASSPCDLLIVDEIGPVEMDQGVGFASAFDLLRIGRYRRAIVVVRPELVEAFAARIGLPCERVEVEELASREWASLLVDVDIPPLRLKTIS